MESHRERLRQRDPGRIAACSGARWEQSGPGKGTLSLEFMQRTFAVRVPDYVVSVANASETSTMDKALVTTYLLTADGTGRTGEWVAFRELPDGIFYHQAFTGYTAAVLTRELGNDLQAFERGARATGGHRLSALGDAAYEFQILPRLWVAVVYWLGDEEDGFPPRANLLFDRVASHYMITDGLAIIGSQLTRRILAQSA